MYIDGVKVKISYVYTVYHIPIIVTNDNKEYRLGHLPQLLNMLDVKVTSHKTRAGCRREIRLDSNSVNKVNDQYIEYLINQQ